MLATCRPSSCEPDPRRPRCRVTRTQRRDPLQRPPLLENRTIATRRLAPSTQAAAINIARIRRCVRWLAKARANKARVGNAWTCKGRSGGPGLGVEQLLLARLVLPLVGVR